MGRQVGHLPNPGPALHYSSVLENAMGKLPVASMGGKKTGGIRYVPCSPVGELSTLTR